MRGSSKAPRFEGTFEVYQVEVELYLEEREAWDVVTGAVVCDPNDANQRVDFDNKNRLAKATILRGLRGCQDDQADKVCRMATAKEMWDTIVADKTKRDFPYVSLLKGQLYTTRHVKGQPMAEYLAVMNRIRQQLRTMGTSSVTDDTCKSELVAASMCAEDLLWARKMLKELGFKKKTGKLYLDNQSTIKVCTDAVNFDGVKRFAKKSRKLAELVDKEKLEIEYVSTEETLPTCSPMRLDLKGSRSCAGYWAWRMSKAWLSVKAVQKCTGKG
eukprot:jgi/Phyca11/131794/e_gw1.113.55.1